MPTIIVTTRIAAPIERCFDLARDVDAHARTSAFTGERIVGGRTGGLLEPGDVVVFEARHLGLRWRLSAQIVETDRPTRFVDEMLRGPFASLRHVHEFHRDPPLTVMVDTLTWRAPLGPLGAAADRWILISHLRAYLEKKQANLKRYAETGLV